MQHYKYAELFLKLFCFFGFAEIPGAMQAFILAAKPAFQVIFLCKYKKSVPVDIVVLPFLQHQFKILTKIFSPKCFFK